MTFQKLTFEEDTQSDNSENSNDNQNQQSSHQPSQQQTQQAHQSSQSSPSQQQSSHQPSQQSSSKPIIIETYTPKPGSLDYKTVYYTSMRELVDCQTFVEQYTRQDQLAFLDEFKYDLFYFIQQPIEVQHYVLMMVIAGQRITNQISLPYLLRDKDLLKDLIKEAIYVFKDFTPENIKDLFAKQLEWIISQIDIVRQLNPINMLYIQQMQYEFPPVYLTRLIIRLVELVILHSCQFEDLIAKLTDLKNNFGLDFKQETPQRQPLLFVVWQQESQTVERIGKSEFVYEHPLCQFAVNETFINSILSIDERLLATNGDYYKLIQAYFQSNGHLYMQMLSRSDVENADGEKDDTDDGGVQNNDADDDDSSVQEESAQDDSVQEEDVQEDSMQEKYIQDESIQDKSIQNEHSTLNNTTLNVSISQNISLLNTDLNEHTIQACIICYEELPINQFVKFDSCPHNNVCKKCFVDMIRSQQTSIFCCPTCKKEVIKIEIQCQDEVMKFRI